MERTLDELIAAAGGSRRLNVWSLRRWGREDLLPRPRRRGLGTGQGTRVEYPDGTLEQLQALLTLFCETRNYARLRVLLWLDGYPVPWERVRADLVAALPNPAGWEQVRAGVAEEDDAALDALDAEAVRLAASKDTPIARRWLRSPTGREMFMAQLLMAAALGRFPHGMAEPVEGGGRSYGEVLERGAGVYAARADASHWLTGPPGAVLEAAGEYDGFDVPRLLNALRTATRAEAEEARAAIRAATRSAGLTRVVAKARGTPLVIAGAVAALIYAQRAPGMKAALVDAAKPAERRGQKVRATS
jgi:hypothetical protein